MVIAECFESRVADALLVVGSGGSQQGMCESSQWGCPAHLEHDENEELRLQNPALYNILSKPWMSNRTWTMHIPVSVSADVTENKYRLSRVVLDSGYPKPPSKDLRSHLDKCAHQSKSNTLLYVARYSNSDHKVRHRLVAKLTHVSASHGARLPKHGG